MTVMSTHVFREPSQPVMYKSAGRAKDWSTDFSVAHEKPHLTTNAWMVALTALWR